MSDSRLYSRLLLPKGHGYHPQPFDDLPLESRREGTAIGDVGVVTSDGSFDVIFNICRSANDPLNRFGVPEGFEQVNLGPGDVAPRAQYHRPGSDVSNTKISKRRLDVDAGVENNVFLPLGAGAVVEISTSSKEAAVLLLPDGASRTDLRRLKRFRDYAFKNAQRWYAFVNGDLERMVENGDLYLVTGTDKSSSWSVAAVENHSEDCRISLKLKAAQVGSAGTSCTWEWETASSFADSGPRRRPGDGEWSDNQTVFLRGFKVAIRSSPLKKSAKALSIVDSKPSDILSKSGFLPFSQSPPTSTGTFFRNPFVSGGGGASDDEESVEYFPECIKAYHPASAINEYLLNCSLTADVAVTHDDDWTSILNQNDEEFPEDCEVLRRISHRYTIIKTFGGVWLQDTSQGIPNPIVVPEGVCHDGTPDERHLDAFAHRNAGVTLRAPIQHPIYEPKPKLRRQLNIKTPSVSELVTNPFRDEETDMEGSKERGINAGIKPGSCALCKTLKVECQFKTEPGPCTRCLYGGHGCVKEEMKGITPPRRPPQAHCKPNGASSVSRGPISPMISLTYSHLGQAPLPSISVLPPLHRQPPSSQSTFTLSSPPSQSRFVMKQTPATHCLPVNGNGAMSPPTANGVTPKSPQSDPHLPHGQSVPECDGHRGTARRGAFLSRKQAEAGGNGFSCTVEKLNSTYLPTWSIIDDSPLLGDPPPAYSPDLKGSLPDGNGHTGVSRYAGCLMYMRRMCDVGRGVPRPVSVTRVPDPKKFFQQYATV